MRHYSCDVSLLSPLRISYELYMFSFPAHFRSNGIIYMSKNPMKYRSNVVTTGEAGGKFSDIAT